MRKISALLSILAVVGMVTREGMAQTSPPKTGTRLITLGTQAGPTPRAHRAQSSNLLIVDGTFYVIDAGDGVARRLAKAGVNLRDIGTIFITHHHDDHTAGLGTLMSASWGQNRTAPINVYGPLRTKDLVDAAIKYFSISAEIRIADGGRSLPLANVFFGQDVATGMIYQDANVKVTAVENSHFRFHSGPSAGKHKSYSYRFDTPDRSIVFTGDSGESDTLTEFAKGADLFVTETVSFKDRMQRMIASGQWQVLTPSEQVGIQRQATQGHMTPEIIGKTAARAGVKTVVLSHLTYRDDGNYTDIVEGVRQYFSGRVVVANDLAEF